ncbi:MAG: hypothetical protein A2042_04575 [Candidatus Schekmanbacteria bacterium GWA2_38_11]|uniref:SIS domain-containing protein n=1 Tax=Candidatus Schekmanbacteria bacterium GWA2_38_11 TaxID=1817876 RepID=A0A1F7RBM5_9BACT|nr:MAG: hypothetical protein A2042_04575 [Candidatus Schekmanbacteria bacterium GWA2_38_11]
MKEIKEYLKTVSSILDSIPVEKVDKIINVLIDAYNNRKQIFLFGNGGSAATSSHLACDLGKGVTTLSRKRFKVYSLADCVPLMTAWANDTDYEFIFSRQMENFIDKGDIAFALSGSGNSKNILNALELAREKGALTIGLTGFTGGKMKDLCNICVVVESNNMQQIEDVHMILCHIIFSRIRDRLSVD